MTGGIVAVVPARGGSKRLPRKNVRPIAGKPMVAFTLEAARGCRLVRAVYVSSEDIEVREIAGRLGAGVIERPASLAEDHVQNTDVVRHALDSLAAQGERFDHVVLLQPTSPLRTARHLEECLAAYLERGAASVVSVCPAEHHPATLLVERDGLLEPYETGADVERRQDTLPVAYRPNGAIHALATSTFLARGRFVVAPCLAYVMSREDSVDVDRELDVLVADLLLRRAREGKEGRA